MATTMLTDFLSTFFALLSLLALAIAFLLIVSMVVGDRFGLIRRLSPALLEIASAIALCAMFGSLYLSEIAGYSPCRMCWIQRAFMYPAALMLVGSLITKSKGLAGVAGALAALGIPISIFHRLEQAGYLTSSTVCDELDPCSVSWIKEFGFITIPTMAGFGFSAIAALVMSHYWYAARS